MSRKQAVWPANQHLRAEKGFQRVRRFTPDARSPEKAQALLPESRRTDRLLDREASCVTSSSNGGFEVSLRHRAGLFGTLLLTAPMSSSVPRSPRVGWHAQRVATQLLARAL